MRIGQNPESNKKSISLEAYHRVIVPVYIPDFTGYFKDLLEVFTLCIDSLLLTVHEKTRITIYNNNCDPKVKQFIDKKCAESIIIDQVFHSKLNLGKINAILASAKGNLEPIITITDADVLFKKGWQEAVENIFYGFPEAGTVSPVPSSLAYNNHTANNWIYSLLKGKLFFESVKDPKALVRFDDSLGNAEKMYKPIHLENFLILRNKSNNCEAVMGCGHFVASMRREVFDKGPNEPAFIKIRHGVETKFIDTPNEALGYLRLASKENYAFHMGNVTEPWMYEEFEELKIQEEIPYVGYEKVNNARAMNSFYRHIGVFIKKLIGRKRIKKAFFKTKGMTGNY